MILHTVRAAFFMSTLGPNTRKIIELIHAVEPKSSLLNHLPSMHAQRLETDLQLSRPMDNTYLGPEKAQRVMGRRARARAGPCTRKRPPQAQLAVREAWTSPAARTTGGGSSWCRSVPSTSRNASVMSKLILVASSSLPILRPCHALTIE